MAKDPTKQPLDFEAMITEGADLWRERSQHLDAIERGIASAAGDPARMRMLAKYVTEVANLSPQQGEIFDRWRVGMKIKDIAAELGISENQVSVQQNNVTKKLSQAREAAGF